MFRRWFALRSAAAMAAAVAFLSPPTVSAQPAPFTDHRSWPETPAGERAREVLEVLSSGERERMRAMVEGSFAAEFRGIAPMEDHLGIFDQQWATSHGYDFHSVRTYEPPRPETVCVVIARNRLTEAWTGIVVEVEAEPPHLIAGIQVTPARPPADAAAQNSGPLTAEAARKELDSFIDRLVNAEVFSGTVLLAKDGEVLYTKSVGEASKEYHAPIRLDTKFNLGSMNKMFTAVAVAQLVEQGKVGWEDPISRWVDASWLPKEVTDTIQVRHLLTHTSGLGSYFNNEYDKSSRLLFRSVEDYKPLVKDDRPRFTPGTRWAYSNTGMLLAGVVVEKASGMDYFDYVRKNIYEPAGMTNTDCYEMDRFPENLAMGYSRGAGSDGESVWVNNLYSHVLRGGPAGGGFSTVEDLLRFDRALRAGKLVKPDTVALLTSPKPEVSSPDYGYGFGVGMGPQGRVAGHSGGFEGISSTLDMYLDSGWTLAVMSNYSGGMFPVSEKLREVIGRME